jgi:hypothetical protein
MVCKKILCAFGTTGTEMFEIMKNVFKEVRCLTVTPMNRLNYPRLRTTEVEHLWHVPCAKCRECTKLHFQYD